MIQNQYNSICNVVNQFKKTILKTEQDFIGAPNGIINVNETNSDSPSLPKNYHLIQSPTKLPYSTYIANNNNNNNNNMNGVSPLLQSTPSTTTTTTTSNASTSPIIIGNNSNNNTVGGTGSVGSNLSVKLHLGNNKKSTIYILVNIALCSITNCHDSIIVLGPCIDNIDISDCSKLTVISTTKGIRIKTSNQISLYICTNQKPIITSECRDIKLAPYNTHYPNLETQLITSKLFTNLSNNYWNTPLILNSISNLNSNSSSDSNGGNNHNIPLLPLEPIDIDQLQQPQPQPIETDSDNNNIYSIMDANDFYPFTVPFLIKGKTKSNPCELPPNYIKCLASKTNSVNTLHKLIQQTTNDPKTKATLLHLIESKFQEWLIETDNIRQINDLINMKR